MRFSAPLALLASLTVALVAITPAIAATPKHKAHTVRCHLLVNGKKKWTKCPAVKNGKNGANGHDGVGGFNGLNGPKGDTGAAGSNGVNGRDGLNGKDGLNGVSGYEVNTYDYISGIGHRPGHDGMDLGYVGAGSTSVATVACSSQNKVAISGGYFVRNGSSDKLGTTAGNGVGVAASFPGRMDWDTNTPKPNRNDGWIIQFSGADVATFDVTLYVVCVNAA